MRDIHVKTLGLVVVAAFATSAIASATASARLPELLNSAGLAPVKKRFTGTSTESTLEARSGANVKCKGDTITGKVTGLKTAEAELVFTGCTTAAGLLKCKSAGANSGEIAAKVDSTLVYIDKAKKEVGLLSALVGVLTIECTGLLSETLKVRGNLICPIAPVNKLGINLTVTCKATKGVQEVTEDEVEGESEIVKTETNALEVKGEGSESFGWELAGFTSTETLTFEEEVHILA